MVFRMNPAEITEVMDFIMWWTSSTGDELTKRFAPDNLTSFFDYFDSPAGRIGFSAMELLMLFTEILMTELTSNLEAFDNVNEWLQALGEYWAAETARWKAAIMARMAEARPMVKVSIMVYEHDEPRRAKPTLPSEFKDMLDTNRFEIFRNTTIQAANRL